MWLLQQASKATNPRGGLENVTRYISRAKKQANSKRQK
jgi:hypothetical protein